MARIPDSFIDDLMARTDLVELINRRVPLKKAGKNYSACCPFHNEKSPSFTVSPDKQFYHCFGCGANGTAIGFLMEYDQMEFLDAIDELAQMHGVEVPRDGADSRANQDQLKPLFELLGKVSDFYQAQLRKSDKSIAYLKKRGVSGDVARQYGIGYAPDGWETLVPALGGVKVAEPLNKAGMLIERDAASKGGAYDRFRDRLMFPIRDQRGRTIGFGGRVFGDEKPKYLNSPETPVFHKGRELYGLWEARQVNRDFDRLLVVEGYMDVVGLAEHGVTNAVATLGTATTNDHLQRLYRLTPEIVFSFDGDQAGRKAAWRALENALPAMKDGRQARFLFLPDGEDPDTMVKQEGKEAFEQRVSAAMPLSQFLLDTMASQVDMTALDGRARFAELVKPHLAKLPEGPFRDLLTMEVSKRSGLDPTRLASRMDPAPSPSRVIKPKVNPSATPVRRAITLLVNHPKLASKVANTLAMRQADIRGAELLADLIDYCRDNLPLAPAGLLERWRERKEHGALQQLLGAAFSLEAENIEQEFVDCLNWLLKQQKKTVVFKEGIPSTLKLSSESEKNRLRALFPQKDEKKS
jgi:DNA primase